MDTYRRCIVLFFVIVFFEPAIAQTGRLIGEAGSITIRQTGKNQWYHRDFSINLNNPVVVAQGVSYNEQAPLTVRVKNVTSGGFDYQLDEWDYLDGIHGTETVHFIVIEAGQHTLGDGRKVIAGFDSNVSSTPKTISLGSYFTSTPVVLSQVVSVNDPAAVVTRHKSIAASGFQIRLQGQESVLTHGSESVAFIALQPGNGRTGGKEYSAKRTADAVTHNFYAIRYGKTFPSVPIFVASMQDAEDPDPSGIRFRYTTTTGIQIKIEEEKSKSSDVTHAAEPVGYLAIERGLILTGAPDQLHPWVSSTTPSAGAVNVRRDTHIAAGLSIPNQGLGVDPETVTPATVRLYPSGKPDAPVAASRNTSGGGDAIVLQPLDYLAANTTYVFEVTSGVRDLSGATFVPYQMSFTTGTLPAPHNSNIQFEKVPLPGATGKYTSLVFGPDGKLYALQNNGYIRRWTVKADGTLTNMQVIGSLRTAEGGDRYAIGLAFDPAARANNLIVWVSHSSFGLTNMPDWAGKITRLSGPNLGNVKTYVVGLPRAVLGHLTNSLAFGPDRFLYVAQGSTTATGEADTQWGNRPERKLSAAILRVDVQALASQTLPLDVKTEEGGTYDPFAPDAPVKLFATGLRNAYDLVWHTNGNLYVPTNGSSDNGRSPASVNGTLRPDQTRYNGPVIPAVDSIRAQSDFLFRIPPPANGTWSYRYFGHPNPTRGEYVLNGGNPTGGYDPAEVPEYPVGIQPDVKWQGFAYNFGPSLSTNGVIEYKSNTFDGALKNRLLVVRYSGGDDIIVLKPNNTNGNIPPDGDLLGLTGFTQFADPLDLVENTANGHIYVSEFAGEGKITLLRPIAPGSTNQGNNNDLLAATNQNENSTPDHFALLDNYPNPFNPQTTIRYDLAERVHVTLEVYDLAGRRVALLVNQMQPAGRYAVTYDAGHLASGVYIYRLDAGSFSTTGRMLLVK